MVMKTYNCPVCGQTGLPDYRNQQTVCPQCDSDLKPFMLLTALEKEKNGSFLKNWLVISLIIALLILSGFFFKNKVDSRREMTKVDQTHLALLDSIKQLHKSMSQLENDSSRTESKTPLQVKYKVRKGDNAWKIAKFFYGAGSKYKLVEDQNNLTEPYQLNIDQILTIKLGEE